MRERGGEGRGSSIREERSWLKHMQVVLMWKVLDWQRAWQALKHVEPGKSTSTRRQAREAGSMLACE